MPPRHGKSEFASKSFPPWYLGLFPSRRIILASYAAEFAAGWGRKARDLVDEFGEHLFDIRLKEDVKAADAWEIEGHGGGMQTCGVGGPLTGKGADVLIIDDPVKNAEEANSQVYRDKAWDWYVSTAYTRLEPGAAVILIQTRWHEEDLAGRVLKHAKETGEVWTVLNMPALSLGCDIDPLGRDAGAALWPERYDVVALAGIRKTLGSYWFSALYQGSPIPAEGGAFKRSWLRYWNADGELYLLDGRPVAKKHCRRFGIVDIAFSLKKEADYTVVLACAVTPDGRLILLDMHRERMEGPAIVRAIKAMSDRHDLAYVGVEDVAGTVLVIQAARKAGLTIRSLRADKDKLSRAIPATIRMEAEQVFIPESALWRDEFEHELLSFPHGAHDDQVDCLAYAAVEVQRFGGAVEPDGYKELRRQVEQDEREQRLMNPNDPVWWDDDE